MSHVLLTVGRSYVGRDSYSYQSSCISPTSIDSTCDSMYEGRFSSPQRQLCTTLYNSVLLCTTLYNCWLLLRRYHCVPSVTSWIVVCWILFQVWNEASVVSYAFHSCTLITASSALVYRHTGHWGEEEEEEEESQSVDSPWNQLPALCVVPVSA